MSTSSEPRPPAGLRRLLYRMHDARRLYWRLFEPTIVGVRALVVQRDEVLLVRHTYLPGWYLPGGRVDRGETAQAAVLRELEEECAITAEDATLLGVYQNREQNRNDHILLYHIDRFAPGPPPSRLRRLEIADARFFPRGALPEDTSPASLRRIHEHAAQDGRGAPQRAVLHW